MRKFHFPLLVLCLLSILALAVVSVTAAGGQKSLQRSEDQIIVAGRTLPAAMGWPIAQVRAFRFAQGQAVPIPFQIDEKLKNGKYALTAGNDRQADDGVFDDNDELVFMASDTGDQGAKSALPNQPTAVAELTISDPADGGKAWVYLARYETNPPPLSTGDYVVYDNTRTFIDTLRYQMGFHQQALLSIGHLSVKPAGGGDNTDIVDRLKVRFSATTLGGMVKIEKNENEFVSRTLGWIDGPVRIVRATANQMMLWKIKTPSAYLYNIYYVNSFEFPTEVNLPFNPAAVMSDIHFRVTSDGICGQKGKLFYNSNNLAGMVIDGAMSDAENKLNLDPYKWSAVTGPNNSYAWINRLVYDAAATPAVPKLYYRDDRTSLDNPEDDPGQCGEVGYSLINLEKVKKGKLRLLSIMYNAPQFTLNKVNRYMQILDRPLKVSGQLL